MAHDKVPPCLLFAFLCIPNGQASYRLGFLPSIFRKKERMALVPSLSIQSAVSVVYSSSCVPMDLPCKLLSALTGVHFLCSITLGTLQVHFTRPPAYGSRQLLAQWPGGL